MFILWRLAWAWSPKTRLNRWQDGCSSHHRGLWMQAGLEIIQLVYPSTEGFIYSCKTAYQVPRCGNEQSWVLPDTPCVPCRSPPLPGPGSRTRLYFCTVCCLVWSQRHHTGGKSVTSDTVVGTAGGTLHLESLLLLALVPQP